MSGTKRCLVFMFPGQSSRYPEMIDKILAEHRQARTIIQEASDLLGRDIASHFKSSNTEMFKRNRDVQVGVFLANHLHLSLLTASGIDAKWSLGLSLGEYNHLVHIGALTFHQALALVDRRGSLYDEGPAGVMVSIFPVEAGLVEQKIAELGLAGRAAVALYNSPRQQVLSGEREAVEKIVAALDDEAFIEATEIESRIPMHAPIFSPVAKAFGRHLEGVSFQQTRLSYVPNVSAEMLGKPCGQEIRDRLTRHVCEPVRWRASVDAIAASTVDPLFLEVGPRSVLSNLFGRGWTPGQRARTDAPENWTEHLARVIGELADGAG